MQMVPALILRAMSVGDSQVLRPDAGLQAVLSVIRELGHGIEVLIVKRLNAYHRSENLLAHHAHVAIGFRQHGGLDKIAMPVAGFSADHDLRALASAGLDEPRHAVMLLLRNQRSEIDSGIEAMADLELAGFRHHSVDDAIVH